MDLAQLHELLTPLGQEALEVASTLAPDERSLLRAIQTLDKRFPTALVRAALETVLLRHKARGKFTRADRMYFTREALEQASSEPVARHRARRFTGVVADLCCGIGGDALALADHASVIAIDRDPLRLAMAGHNVAAYDRQVTAVEGDVLRLELPKVDAAFVDPDRRVDGRRVLSALASQPSLPDLLSRFSHVPLGVKLAPGVPLAELAAVDGELEFLSLEGELKECVLWTQSLATTRRRATLLPGAHELCGDAAALWPTPGPPRGWLYDPDPAVVRAGLVGDLAAQLGAHPFDPTIAYLTSPDRRQTPFARTYAIDAAMPFHLKRLREYLREHHVGRVEIQRRGSAVDPVELERGLKLRGSDLRTIVLTRVLGKPYALVAQGIRDSSLGTGCRPAICP